MNNFNNSINCNITSSTSFSDANAPIDLIKNGNNQLLDRFLKYNNPASETLIEMVIYAQKEKKGNVVEKIISNLNIDICLELLEKTIHLFDNDGNNLAIEFAKILGPSALTFVEEKILSKENEIFKICLSQQCKKIALQLEKAFENQKKAENIPLKLNHWWSSQSTIQKTTFNCQMEIINHLPLNGESIICCAGQQNECSNAILNSLKTNKKLTINSIDHKSTQSLDLIIAPHTLYQEMDKIFEASESLINNQNLSSIERHPLFKYFDALKKKGTFLVTLASGPNIQHFTDLLLNKHELELTPKTTPLNLKIFNQVETFLRCLDIFKAKYEEYKGQKINCHFSFSHTSIPLTEFCSEYAKQYPELSEMELKEREKYIRLLSVFNIGEEIVDLDITIQMTIEEIKEKSEPLSFKPILKDNKLSKNISCITSNDISQGQLDLNKQIQNLRGSELAMPYLKDADGEKQFQALQTLNKHEKINFVDLGGGRGETNAVLYHLQQKGPKINLLNVEPHKPFEKEYLNAHENIGIKNTSILSRKAQHLSLTDVENHFTEKADVLFCSHSLYFLLGDMMKHSLAKHFEKKSSQLNLHPLWKYFEMINENGVIIITLQSGAGVRLMRNALLGNHGLNPSTSDVSDETVPLLSSFGNVSTFLRYMDEFKRQYEKETHKRINIKMHNSVSNVPLGQFKVVQDSETNGYVIQNPKQSDESNWITPKMLDFYGNWDELQMLATLNLEKAKKLPKEILEKHSLKDVTEESIKLIRDTAKRTQEVFLHILPIFAPGLLNMQHPNITLEISLKN